MHKAYSQCRALKEDSLKIVLEPNESNRTRSEHCSIIRKACNKMFMPDIIKIEQGSILTHSVNHDCLHESGYPSFPYAWFQLFPNEDALKNHPYNKSPQNYWGDSVTYIYRLKQDLPYVICMNSNAKFSTWLKTILPRKERNPDKYARDYSLSAFITQILGMPYAYCPDNMLAKNATAKDVIVLPCYGDLSRFLEVVRIENGEGKLICKWSSDLPVGDGASTEIISKPNYFLTDMREETTQLIKLTDNWPIIPVIREKYKEMGLTTSLTPVFQETQQNLKAGF